MPTPAIAGPITTDINVALLQPSQANIYRQAKEKCVVTAKAGMPSQNFTSMATQKIEIFCGCTAKSLLTSLTNDEFIRMAGMAARNTPLDQDPAIRERFAAISTACVRTSF